jgi:hypothetical protein
MSPTRVRTTVPPKNASTVRPRPSYSSSKSEPFLPLPGGASRRQSKGGLRELFSKNKSTKTIDATSQSEESSPDDGSSSLPISVIDASWLPPPLFQAYPQSIKHVTLEASTLSAESILRMNEQRSTNLVYEPEQSTTGVPADTTPPTRRPRQGSTSVAKAEWTRKIYILTTSGHLLQYSGEGSFHRKPEKILQLGKDSAAFASDAIEGRHFVLHVSQSCSDDGEPDLDASKGLFSRIGIKTANARRSTKVLLMVFETPKDLDAWLSVLRKMIGSLGGRPYSPETFVTKVTPALQPVESQRYLVRRDPHQFSREAPPVGSVDAVPAERLSVQSSTYTATDLERLRDSKTSNESTATGAPESSPSSLAQEPSAVTDAPWLELPDLGPSCLVDFSDHGKRDSRLSFALSDLTRQESVDLKPTIRLPRRESLQPWPITKTKPSIPDTEHGQLLNCETIQEQQQGLEGDYDEQTSERPVSLVAPLPTSFSLRHTAPEMSSNQSYSRFLTIASESASELPKRYSSLEYSRSFTRSRTPKMALQQISPEMNLRRPTSMQLRTEPRSMVDMPASSSARCSYRQEGIEAADTPIQHSDVHVRSTTQMSQPGATLAFGPPAGPPPSCPLPAVPSTSLPLRRQSHAARETGPSKGGYEKPSDSS